MRVIRICALILAVFTFPITLQSAPQGSAFTYQGELHEGGIEVTDTCDFSFGLWDAVSGGSEVAMAIDLLAVPVNGGIFTVELDFGAAAFMGEARWLEIAVDCPQGSGTPVVLSPRQELTPAPAAQYSVTTGSVDWSGVTNVPADLADGDDVDDADADPGNELQNLELDGSMLTLSDDPTPVDLSGLLVNTDDQTLAEVLAQGNSADSMAITNLPGPTLAADAATKGYVDAHADADADPANELQDLDLSGSTLSLTGDISPVDLSAFLDDTTCDLGACEYPGRASLSCGGAAVLVNCHVPGAFWTLRNATEYRQWRSVTFGGSRFVAVSTDGIDQVMTSPDGINWTAGSAAEANNWRSVTYGDGLFVAVAQDGVNRVMTSLDGITWTPQSAAEDNSWNSVAYGDGLYVAVAGNGTNRIMTSPDGITWTPRSAPEANTWRGVTYGDGLWVAVAVNGTNRVMTSPDGITWTARMAAEANTWESVTYGDGLFVAVSTLGTNNVMTSPDGINWTARDDAGAVQMYAVTYGGGLFVAVASEGAIQVITSPDGINWTARDAAAPIQWRAVTFGNGIYVATAVDGTSIFDTKRVMTAPGD